MIQQTEQAQQQTARATQTSNEIPQFKEYNTM